jgi:glycosyltransferase involved in cell wall biosynthesis
MESGSTNERTISAIMPMYNASASVERCLEPLLGMLERGEILEIVVVDDCSTDDSPERISGLPVRSFRTPVQSGPGGARNLASLHTGGDILWFVDSDVIVSDNAARLIHAAFHDPDVGAVFGSYDLNPAAVNFLSQYKNLVHRYYHQRGNEEASTFWAGCGAIRADVYAEQGGYDAERYRYPSIEDIELGGRIIRSGKRIRLIPDMQGTHLKDWRIVNLLHTEIFRRALPWSRLMLEQGEMTDDLNVGRGERVRAAVAGFFVLGVLAWIAGLIQWPLFAVIAGIVVIANYDFIAYFARHRGIWFSIKALAYHQLYYLYSGAVFCYAYAENFFRKKLFARTS